jgi:thioredoxin 1
MIEVIKIGTEWCGPCKMMKPTIQKLQEKYDETSGVKITEVDADQDPDVAIKFSVRGVPTIIFLKDGSVDRKTGIMSESQITEIITKLKQ